MLVSAAPQLRQVVGQRVRQLARPGLAARHVVHDGLGRGLGQLPLARAGGGRLVALADAGGLLHRHVGAARQGLARAGQQVFAAGQRKALRDAMVQILTQASVKLQLVIGDPSKIKVSGKIVSSVSGVREMHVPMGQMREEDAPAPSMSIGGVAMKD